MSELFRLPEINDKCKWMNLFFDYMNAIKDTDKARSLMDLLKSLRGVPLSEKHLMDFITDINRLSIHSFFISIHYTVTNIIPYDVRDSIFNDITTDYRLNLDSMLYENVAELVNVNALSDLPKNELLKRYYHKYDFTFTYYLLCVYSSFYEARFTEHKNKNILNRNKGI